MREAAPRRGGPTEHRSALQWVEMGRWLRVRTHRAPATKIRSSCPTTPRSSRLGVTLHPVTSPCNPTPPSALQATCLTLQARWGGRRTSAGCARGYLAPYRLASATSTQCTQIKVCPPRVLTTHRSALLFLGRLRWKSSRVAGLVEWPGSVWYQGPPTRARGLASARGRWTPRGEGDGGSREAGPRQG